MNGSKTTVDVEIIAKDEENVPISDLPLVDSLLAYKSDVYGCKTPLVPPRKSREHSKERIVKENRCSTDVETEKYIEPFIFFNINIEYDTIFGFYVPGVAKKTNKQTWRI